MKDFFSAFGSEFFRPLATLLLPGAFALAPGAIAALWTADWAEKVMPKSHGEIIGAFLLLSLFVGLVLEDWGSRLEVWLFRVRCFDEQSRSNTTKRSWRSYISSAFREREECQADRDWYDYLRLAFDIEPVGHRYMRGIVLRLKFELGCCVACVAAIFVSWASLLWSSLPDPYVTRLAATVLFLLLGPYFGWESWTSVGLLMKVRREMLKGIKLVPPARQLRAAS